MMNGAQCHFEVVKDDSLVLNEMLFSGLYEKVQFYKIYGRKNVFNDYQYDSHNNHIRKNKNVVMCCSLLAVNGEGSRTKHKKIKTVYRI